MEKNTKAVKAKKGSKEVAATDPRDVKAKALAQALAKIEKDHGHGSIMKLGEEKIDKIEVIPTGSIGLNYALGVGGFPKGRIIEIFGPESSGKTTLALHAIAQCQKAGGTAALIDAEHAFDRFYAEALGVDTDNLLISQPDNGEQALEITEKLIRSSAVDRHYLKNQHHLHLHQPASGKDRRHVRQSGNDNRRKCTKILCFCTYRHTKLHNSEK